MFVAYIGKMNLLKKCLLALLVFLCWKVRPVSSQLRQCIPGSVTFLSYFPCTHVENLTSVEECDIFAYTAARLAAERTNEELTNVTLIPIATGKNPQEVDADAVVFRSADYIIRSVIHGAIGPGHSNVAKRIFPIFSSYLGIPEVSYGATDTLLNHRYFYRNLPSDQFLNEARFMLVDNFQWYKVGTLASDDVHVDYSKAVHDFNTIYTANLGILGFDTAFTGTFQTPESAEPALQEMAIVGLRIIIGLFGPSDARRVLCRAHRYGLTTSEHVWILPSYYNPNWWKLDDTELEGLPEAEACSNDDMIDILNSALFVDTIKYPLHQSTGLNMLEFHTRLIAETRELFPSLSDADLTPFLLHSRASRAYEAVWLMALALNTTGGAVCRRRRLYLESLQYSLETSIFCEWCSIFSDCMRKGPCTICSTPDNQLGEQHLELITNYYGQILVTQFIDGVHCPIGFYWHDYHGELEFVKFADLESSSHCLHKLQLDASILNYTSGCPSDFWWKGRSSPPSGDYSVTYSDIGTTSLVITCVLIAFGLVYAITLLVANIVWRNNKHMKASSPMLNIVIITSFILLLPTPLNEAMVLSVKEYNISRETSDVLCQITLWICVVSHLMIYVTVLVKNWRVYRIFYNYNLKEHLSWWLSDMALLLIVVILTLPAILELIVWTVVDPLHLEYTIETKSENDVYSYEFINRTFCDCDYFEIWSGIWVFYDILVVIMVLFLAYQNSRIVSVYRREGHTSQRAMKLLSRFQSEGKAAQIALIVLIISTGAVIGFVALLTLLGYEQGYLSLYWFGFALNILVPAAILTILVLAKLIHMYKDHRKKMVEVKRKERQSVFESRYRTSIREIQKLKEILEEKEERIASLRERSSTSSESSLFSPLSSPMTIVQTLETIPESEDCVIEQSSEPTPFAVTFTRRKNRSKSS